MTRGLGMRDGARMGRCTRTLLCLAPALLAILLTGCGQKGPLYLPDQPRQTVKKNVTLPAESKEEKEEKKEKESSKDEPKAP